MINHINIKNFAIIENLDIDFFAGFSSITGETGAGKSIIIEAISMALGSRADKTFIRSGKEKAIIQISAMHREEEYVLYRELGIDGRSLCKINGEIVPLGVLSDFSKKIADIHGQYAHQSLLDSDCHINLVDIYMKDKVVPQKKKVSELFFEYIEKSKKVENFLKSKETSEKEKEFMAYQLDEIEKINPLPMEDEKLTEEISILKNKEKIFNALNISYELAYQSENSALSNLDNIRKNLSDISSFYEINKEIENIDDIYYRLEDFKYNIREKLSEVNMTTNSLDTLIERLEEINRLKMKHGGTLESVFAYKEKAKLSLSSFENREELFKKSIRERDEIEKNLKEASLLLREIRKSSALHLQEAIVKELKELNFDDGEMRIDFNEKHTYTEDGLDKVEFMIKTNKGDEFKPLSKIASGGEISRIMLAFKTVSCEYDNIPTIIFDEIDTGISGHTASVVGKKLLEIGKKRQVITITHLPQVAAYGDYNYAIIKSSTDNSTYTTVEKLSEIKKVNEIARLLSGENITPSSIANAKDLIAMKNQR